MNIPTRRFARDWLCAAQALYVAAAVAAAPPEPPTARLLPGAPGVASAAPKDSDVMFSPRFDRPEAPSVAAAYGANRMEWSYISSGPTLTALKAASNGRFGAAINNNVATPNNVGAAIDFDGKPIVAPWMRARGTLWNTCAAPETMQALKSWIGKHLAAGATSIQFDDAGMQFDSSFWGVGDFSQNSLRGFRAWVAAKNAAGVTTPLTPAQAGDYRDWLKQTYQVVDNADYIKRVSQFATTDTWRAYLQDAVTQCLTELRGFIKAKGGESTALSLNLYTAFPWAYNSFLHPFADYVVSEVAPDHSEFQHLLFLSTWLRMEGQRWAPVFPLTDKATLRTRIATAYAVGGNPLVPWDVYIPGSAKSAEGRFFGEAKDFADLFKFVRRQSALLDGWELLSRVNLVVYHDPASITEALAQLKRLADLQVPYAPYLRDNPAFAERLRNEPGVQKSYRLVASKGYAKDAQPLLAGQSNSALAELAVASAVTPGMAVLVKGHASVPRARVVHVLRTGDVADAPAKVGFTLSAWALGGTTSFKARLLSPDGAVTPLGTIRRGVGQGLALSIPAPAEWSIVELTPG